MTSKENNKKTSLIKTMISLQTFKKTWLFFIKTNGGLG
jgi:hypothetical protein